MSVCVMCGAPCITTEARGAMEEDTMDGTDGAEQEPAVSTNRKSSLCGGKKVAGSEFISVAVGYLSHRTAWAIHKLHTDSMSAHTHTYSTVPHGKAIGMHLFTLTAHIGVHIYGLDIMPQVL